MTKKKVVLSIIENKDKVNQTSLFKLYMCTLLKQFICIESNPMCSHTKHRSCSEVQSSKSPRRKTCIDPTPIVKVKLWTSRPKVPTPVTTPQPITPSSKISQCPTTSHHTEPNYPSSSKISQCPSTCHHTYTHYPSSKWTLQRFEYSACGCLKVLKSPFFVRIFKFNEFVPLRRGRNYFGRSPQAANFLASRLRLTSLIDLG